MPERRGPRHAPGSAAGATARPRVHQVTGNTKVPDRPAQVCKARPLPGPMQDLLREGVDVGNRSEAAMRVTVSMVNCGWSWADFHAAMRNPTNTLGLFFLWRSNGAERSAEQREQMLRRIWDKACRFVVARPAIRDQAEARQEIGLTRVAADFRPWTGRSRLRDRTVHRCLLDIATEQGSTRVGVSVRTLCERTPYRSAGTVSRALTSLARQRILRIERRPDPDDCNAYQLLPADAWVAVTATRSPPSRCEGRVADAATPELALALGSPYAALLAAALTDDPLSARQVAARAGVSRCTANKRLPRLARIGLAVQLDGGWVRGDTPPEIAAMREGAMDVALARHSRHEHERSN